MVPVCARNHSIKLFRRVIQATAIIEVRRVIDPGLATSPTVSYARKGPGHLGGRFRGTFHSRPEKDAISAYMQEARADACTVERQPMRKQRIDLNTGRSHAPTPRAADNSQERYTAIGRTNQGVDERFGDL